MKVPAGPPRWRRHDFFPLRPRDPSPQNLQIHRRRSTSHTGKYAYYLSSQNTNQSCFYTNFIYSVMSFSFSPKSLWPSGRQMFRVKTPTAGSCCSPRNWKRTQEREPGEWPRRNHVNTNPVIIIIFQSAVIQITYKIISVRSSARRRKIKEKL